MSYKWAHESIEKDIRILKQRIDDIYIEIRELKRLVENLRYGGVNINGV